MNTLANHYVSCPAWLYRLLPFLKWWPMVNRGTVRSDLIAGLTGAIIVLPQGVAFAPSPACRRNTACMRR